MRRRFQYFSPDEWYEAVVDRLVRPGCRWIDVGGGKSIFPENETLSRALATRCALLVGVDPSENIDHNDLVHRRVRSTIEEYRPGDTFDLATFRMVAEHVERPRRVVEALATLLRTGGHAVIFTPYRWSPGAIAASLIPDQWHDVFARLMDTRRKEDVFPTFYRMNTRRRLRELFEAGGFVEAGFAHVANCRTFHRIRAACFVELSVWRVLGSAGLGYPENDLLAVYRKL